MTKKSRIGMLVTSAMLMLLTVFVLAEYDKVMVPKYIHSLVKAQMDFTINRMHGVQEIDDPQKLRTIEDILSDAKYFGGGTKCPFQEALLTLTRNDGMKITLMLASDGCCVYKHDDRFFIYKQGNSEILGMFDHAKWSVIKNF